MLWLLVAVFSQGLQIPPRDAQPVAPGSAIVRGRVTDRESGIPLSGIIVRIPASRGGQPVLEARSDADGFYQITSIPAGSYILVAVMPDYRSSHLPQVYGDTRAASARWTSGSAARVDIKVGEVRNGVDFALTRAFGIGGRVVDEAGQPMSNVRVRIDWSTAETAGLGSFRDTDDRGEFRLFGLPPGRYRVCAEPLKLVYTEAAPPDAPAVSCYPADAGRTDQALIIAAADPEPIQLQMRRGGTVTVSGTVLDAAGVPAEGASVTLGRRSGTSTTTNYPLPIWAGAQFLARGVSPGEYFIAASGGRAVDTGQIERQYAYVPLTVGASDVAGLTIRLAAPVTLAGHVTVADGAPLPGGTTLTVQAALVDRVASAFNRAVPTGVVRDDLTFELTGIVGAATISCSGLPAGWIVDAVRYRGADVTDLAFTPAGDTRSLDVAVSSRGAMVSGTIVGSESAAGRNAIVWLFPVDAARQVAGTGGRVTLATVGGRFALDAVRAGEYYVVAVDAAPWQSARAAATPWDRLARVADRITLGEGDRRTIDVRLAIVPEER